MAQPNNSSLQDEVEHATRDSLEDLFPRLHMELLPLAIRVINVFNRSGCPSVVKPRPADVPFGGEYVDYYKSLRLRGTTYYIIEESEEEGNRKFPGELSLESNAHILGAATHNCCALAALLCLPVVNRLIEGNPYLKECEWACVDVAPKTVFFPAAEVGKEDAYNHDILIIRAEDGKQFVFDPTGYQFGFAGFLWKLEQYQASFIVDDIEIKDAEEQSNNWRVGIPEKMKLFLDEIETKTVEELKRGEFWQDL